MLDSEQHNHAVRQRLDDLQWGTGGRGQVVYLPAPFGLGGQIAGRIQVLLLALALGRQAVFLSLEDRPYGQTFDAMHPPVDPQGGRETWPLADLGADQADPVVCYDPSRMSLHGAEAERALLDRIAARLGARVDDRLALEGAILGWMKPTGAMTRYCREQQDRLAIGGDTLGVHFRRGDKAVETAFVPAGEFNQQIARMHKTWPFTSVFLASDSPDAWREIQCPPGVRLIFDSEEQRYNNANHKMLINTPDLADQETRVAFKNIALLSACGGVIGQNNAHFASLAAATIVARDGHAQRTHLIDGRIAEKKSRLLAVYFRAKKGARAILRRIFPQLATAARLERMQKRTGQQ